MADWHKSNIGNHSGKRRGQEIPTLGQTRVPGAPHDTAEPRPRLGPWPAYPKLSPIFPCRTYLSYSDRVRNMARVGEGGSGYTGTLRANTSAPAPNFPTLPQNRGPAPNRACARDPFNPPPCACLLLVVRSSR